MKTSFLDVYQNDKSELDAYNPFLLKVEKQTLSPHFLHTRHTTKFKRQAVVMLSSLV